jgi:hypothetical protein
MLSKMSMNKGQANLPEILSEMGALGLGFKDQFADRVMRIILPKP